MRQKDDDEIYKSVKQKMLNEKNAEDISKRKWPSGKLW